MSNMVNRRVRDIVDRYVELNISLNRKFSRLFRYVLGDTLTMEQFVTMLYIKKLGTCTPSELAGVFSVKKSAITSIINRLFEKQWVERMSDPNDRRTIYLKLTETGNMIYTEMEGKLHDLLERILNEFDDDHINTFLINLERLDVLIGGITEEKEDVQG